MQTILIIAAVVVVILVYLLLARKRLMSPERFAEAVRRRLVSHHPGVSVKSAEGFDWVVDVSGDETSVFLHNIYAAYRQFPMHFEEMVDRFIKGVITSREDTSELAWEDAKPRLLPCLKPQLYLDQARQLSVGDSTIDKLIVFDYKRDLRTLIAIDSELTMSFANSDNLEKWGVTKDELLQVAIDNLSKLTAPHWAEATERAREHGVFAFALHDGYDASRILLPDFYERASRALGADRLLVGVPNRDFVCAIAENAPWRDKFTEQNRRDAENYDHPISPDPVSLP
jgi:uncharacterized protein YtpQ (UPF0354 family)